MNTPLIDYPDKWILRLFKLHEHEAGGQDAVYYPDGIRIAPLQLEPNEWVYGHFDSNKRKYYFTQIAIIVLGQQQEKKIKFADVIRTNGALRSGHKRIYVETIDGEKHKIYIEEFPYRIQQLFYQLIARHGSLLKDPLFDGPLKLKQIATDLSSTDVKQFGFTPTPQIVCKQIKLSQYGYHIDYHGTNEGGQIWSDPQGILILRIRNDVHEWEIFNSTTDGYRGVADTIHGIEKPFKKDFKSFQNEYHNLILVFGYSMPVDEWEDIVEDFGFHSTEELNNLFVHISIYGGKNGHLQVLMQKKT
ncbi:MAG: hypothetical protein AAF587_26955 [Bacteroidota bacterium]